MSDFINGEEITFEQMQRMREDDTPGMSIILNQHEAGKWVDDMLTRARVREAPQPLQEQRNTGEWKGTHQWMKSGTPLCSYPK